MTRWPLRWTIPSIALVLVLLTELVIGAAVLGLLQRTLRDQVDRRLDEAANEILSRPEELRRQLGQAGTDDEGGLRGPRSDVVVVVFRESGDVAPGITRRLNDGRPIPSVDIRLNETAPYTDRVGGEAWRVRVVRDDDTAVTLAVMMPLRDQGSTTATLRRGIIALGIGVAVVAAGAAAWATRRSLRPLRDAEHTAAAIAAGDLGRRVPAYPATSEAGSLAASLNVMLDRLSESMDARRASEERLRRFVSDASHELRTPLAAIRGYAELSRIGADSGVDAMARIEANAERMAAMVEDLLVLARYDESAASLAGDDEVDMAALLADTASDVRAQDLSRTVTVTCGEGVRARGSARHLGQLLANLAGNVLDHTPEGTPVEFAARTEAGQVVVTVRDHGPGFGSASAAQAFDRFYRADASRTRQTGGSGLGLAIVAAIAAAHGGTVAAADAAGGGAIVTVTLPAA